MSKFQDDGFSNVNIKREPALRRSLCSTKSNQFYRSAPEKTLQAVFVHDRLEGRTGLAQAEPASQRCICGMSKKKDNTSVQSICAKLALD